MTHIRNGRTRRQRRRAGTTLVLAAASGGLLAAAMAGSPTARADNPYTDILNDVQGSITFAEGDFSAAGTDFSTAGDTNEGLVAAFAGLDNLLISPADYTLVGLTAAATGTDFSNYDDRFFITYAGEPLTAAGQEGVASTDLSDMQGYLTDAGSSLSSGDYTDAALYASYAAYEDVLASQADTLAALFSAGL
jgi:hypothetical protein